MTTEAAARRWPEALRSLRHRDFRRFWFGLIISVVGTWMQMVAQGWLVLKLTDSPLYLGLVGACGSLPMLVFALPAGVAADRFTKQRLLIITQSLAMVQAFVLAGLVHFGVVRIWHVMALAACLGTVNAFDMPTRHAMVLDLAAREDVLNAVALNSSAFNSGRIVGPAVAGLLVARAGMAGCFFINGLTFFATIIALLTIRPRPPRAVLDGDLVRHIKDGLAWVRDNRHATWLLALTAVSSIFAMPYTTLMPIFARDVLGVGPQGFGFLMSASGLGALTSALALTAFGSKWRLGLLTSIGSFSFPLALLLVSMAPVYALAAACIYFTGVGMMLFNAVSNTILQKTPPDALRGRVMSLRTFFFAGLGPVGNLQIGVTGEWLGARGAIALGAAACLAMAALAWWRAPEVRRTE